MDRYTRREVDQSILQMNESIPPVIEHIDTKVKMHHEMQTWNLRYAQRTFSVEGVPLGSWISMGCWWAAGQAIRLWRFVFMPGSPATFQPAAGGCSEAKGGGSKIVGWRPPMEGNGSVGSHVRNEFWQFPTRKRGFFMSNFHPKNGLWQLWFLVCV